MRPVFALLSLLLLAGCGSSSAASPTATPQPAANNTPKLQWKQAPAVTIDENARYTATVKTTDGTFTIELFPKIAPLTVNNFVFLARHHFYNGVIFHRIIKNFIIQTGDPLGTGFGGPGYTFKDEKVTMPYARGIVAMANSGPNSNGSQFFIVVAPNQAPLPPKYTIFGKVAGGMAAVLKIANSPVAPSASNPAEVSSPVNPPVMQSVVIHESK